MPSSASSSVKTDNNNKSCRGLLRRLSQVKMSATTLYDNQGNQSGSTPQISRDDVQTTIKTPLRSSTSLILPVPLPISEISDTESTTSESSSVSLLLDNQNLKQSPAIQFMHTKIRSFSDRKRRLSSIVRGNIIQKEVTRKNTDERKQISKLEMDENRGMRDHIVDVVADLMVLSERRVSTLSRMSSAQSNMKHISSGESLMSSPSVPSDALNDSNQASRAMLLLQLQKRQQAAAAAMTSNSLNQNAQITVPPSPFQSSRIIQGSGSAFRPPPPPPLRPNAQCAQSSDLLPAQTQTVSGQFKPPPPPRTPMAPPSGLNRIFSSEFSTEAGMPPSPSLRPPPPPPPPRRSSLHQDLISLASRVLGNDNSNVKAK
jgi:hypothetical protein